MNAPSAPLRAAIYLRQSSDPSGQQFGVDRQEEEVRRYIHARGWEPVEPPFKDNDISAYKQAKPRPEFDRMLAGAEAGEFDVIAARHMDRLTRRLEEFATIKRRCQDAGVALVTTADGVDTSTDGGRMVAGVLAVFAEAEMERKSYRHLSSNVQRAKRGKGWGPRAFGYNGDHDNPQLVPKEAAAVRDAFKSVLAGDSIYSVCVKWNKAGLVTGWGNAWTTTQIRRLLQNPRYAGLRAYRDEIVGKGDWPAIVDEDTYRAMQYKMAERKSVNGGAPARKYLLGSIVHCGVCHEPMSTGWTNNPRKAATEADRAQYRCKTYTCGKVTRRQRMVDPWVENAVLNRIKTKGWRLVAPDDAGDIESLHTEATALRARIDSLGVDYAEGNLTAGQVKIATDKLQKRLSEVETAIGRIANTAVFEGLIDNKHIKKTWDGFGLDRKRAVIQALVEKIVINPLGTKGRGVSKLPMGTNMKIHWRSDN